MPRRADGFSGSHEPAGARPGGTGGGRVGRAWLAALAAVGLAVACEAPPAGRRLATTRSAPARATALAAAEPCWIWLGPSAREGEVGWFRKRFTLSSLPLEARLEGSGDDRLEVWLNGAPVARHDDWTRPFERDVLGSFVIGQNELLVRGANDEGPAAVWLQLVLGMQLEVEPRRLVTDGTWEARSGPAATPAELGAFVPWRAPHVFGPLTVEPWSYAPAAPVARAEDLTLPEGFVAELVLEVPRSRGSWVALALDPCGHLVAAAQEGGLYRVTPAPAGGDGAALVEDLGIDLGEVHGLAWSHGSLWAVAGGSAAEGGGLFRLTDTDGDDRYDEVRRVLALEGSGEHGPHAVVPAPDGRALYLVAGNHTALPDFAATRVPPVWAEDELGRRIEDPGGHAVGIRAPGGFVLEVEPESGRCTLLAVGLRNAYDLAIDARGELFTYDSDMEWDVGLPWYRPPRFLHVVSGADFGWRSGTGKWAEDLPDTLAAVARTGPASPTGLVFGTETSFPDPWRGALFAADWAYGRILALQLAEQGAGFRGTVTTFASGEPLPVTDLVVGPDGALWFTTGGRGLATGLYRVRWAGPPPPEPARAPEDPLVARGRELRRRLEHVHRGEGGDVLLAWQGLGAPDPLLRHAARVAIEHQDPATWSGLALEETRPRAALSALLALARVGPPQDAERIVRRILELRALEQPGELRYDALRVLQLVFLRRGPGEPARQSLLAWLEAIHPTGTAREDRELARLIVALASPNALRELLPRLGPEVPLAEALHVALLLRELEHGWDDAARTAVLDFLDRAEDVLAREGGASARLYVERIREELVAGFDEVTRARLGARLGGEAPPPPAEGPARRFVRAWRTEDLADGLGQLARGRAFAAGAATWEAASCASCHRLAGSGGSAGPDLTGAAGRFSPAELLRTILEPHADVADQYRDTEVRTRDGRVLVGRLVGEDRASLRLRTSPPRAQVLVVPLGQVAERRPHPLSAMPEGLLDTFEREQVLDLLAYVLAGGRADDPAFLED